MKRGVRRWRDEVVVTALATAVAGCGGGGALLHPAHTLESGKASFGAGVSGQFALGGTDDAIVEARGASQGGGFPADQAERERYVRGAIAYELTAPGLAPWVGGRIGLGYDAEAGLTYTGRSMRIDGRWALEGDELALSIGAGGWRVLQRPGSESSIGERSDGGIAGLDTREVAGWGIDVPVLVGWRSDGDVIQAWMGPRAGVELLTGPVTIATNQESRAGPLDAKRFFVGGVLGVAVGVHPIWVAVELDVAYQHATGTLELVDDMNQAEVFDESAEGLVASPAGALILRF